MADGKVAAKLKVTIRAVGQRRRRRGIPVHFAHRRPWTPEEDALLGTASDTETAARLGRHLARICIRRQKLGIRTRAGKGLREFDFLEPTLCARSLHEGGESLFGQDGLKHPTFVVGISPTLKSRQPAMNIELPTVER